MNKPETGGKKAGPPPPPIPAEIKWVTEKSWNDFRTAGLLFFVNSLLHVFGWAICVDINNENGNVTKCYPARVKFRGFDETAQSEEHIKIANYLAENSADLKKEAKL